MRTLGKALDGSEFCARRLQRRNKAAVYQLAVHQNGAGPALALATTFLRAGQPELMPQNVQQPLHGIDANGFWLAIYSERELALGEVFRGAGHRFPSAEAASATMSKISSGRRGMESKRVPSASSTAL